MKDSDRSILHLNSARTAFWFPEWVKDKLEFEDIEPWFDTPLLMFDENEEEDDNGLVPDARALFSAAKNYQRKHLMSWRDLDVDELLEPKEVDGVRSSRRGVREETSKPRPRTKLVDSWRDRSPR